MNKYFESNFFSICFKFLSLPKSTLFQTWKKVVKNKQNSDFITVYRDWLFKEGAVRDDQ